MAAPLAPVTFRFVFGKGATQGRQRTADTSRAIVRNIALYYADEAYERTKDALTQTLKFDVEAELVHMASLFRRHIVGANGNRNVPAGVLRTVSKIGGATASETIASMLPPWAPRSARYLERKKNARAGNAWFDNSLWRARPGAWSPGRGGTDESPLRRINGDFLEQAFGPINVRFFKRNKNSTAPAEGQFGKATHARLQVGSVQVRALGDITPAMLPGLASGTVRATASGNPGLMRLLYQRDPEVEVRLGMMNNGVYRPTLEPFLGFFLTRAIPHAVTARMLKAGGGTLFRRS